MLFRSIGSISVQPYANGVPAPTVEIVETPTSGANRVEVSIGNTDRVYTEARLAEAQVTEAQASTSNKVAVNTEGTQRIYTEARSAAPVVSEVAASPERVVGNYVVQKGDTLSEITEKRFGGLLKDIPENKRGLLMDELFRNVQADSSLRNSLGIRSGDVEMIYPNEKINLDGVESELTRLLEREKTLELFRSSGPLTVEADAEVKTVPITVIEKPVLGGVSVNTENTTYAEAAPDKQVGSEVIKEAIKPPRPFSLNGQFADTPAYKEYVLQTFGTGKAFEQAVERAVTNFDKGTYDIFESFSANYESPYRFLGDMTLQEVTEFEAQPNAEIRAFLKENNIKYETYLEWLDKIDEMVQTLPNQSETKVSDLFTRYVAETQVPKSNTLLK